MEKLKNKSDYNYVNNRANILYNRNVYVSTRPNKKYMIYNDNNKIVHFGDSMYKDYSVTRDENKRRLYLQRSGKIKGNWKRDIFSPNQLSRNLLWN
jgi:hypothetical protein